METLNKPLPQAINEAQIKYMQERVHRGRWSSIRASGIDDVCNRRLFYYLTEGEMAKEFNTDLVAIFEEGKDQEPGVRRFLSELGFEVIKSQSTEKWPEHNISGSVDGIIAYDGKNYLAEIKTVSEYAWDALNNPEDFKEGFYRKWFGQFQIYLLLFGLEQGVFILKRKQAKQIKVIEIGLDYSYAEGLIKKAEAVNLAIKTTTPPEHIQNPVECRKCAFFGTVCNPPMDFGDAILNVDDPELQTKLQRRAQLAPAKSEYEAVDKEIKERFKEIPDAICGDFHITGKESIRTMKATEARELKVWTTKIESLSTSEK